MLPLRYVVHKYTSFIHIFRSSPLLFPTVDLKNSINKYHEHLSDGHGIFSCPAHFFYCTVPRTFLPPYFLIRNYIIYYHNTSKGSVTKCTYLYLLIKYKKQRKVDTFWSTFLCFIGSYFVTTPYILFQCYQQNSLCLLFTSVFKACLF